MDEIFDLHNLQNCVESNVKNYMELGNYYNLDHFSHVEKKSKQWFGMKIPQGPWDQGNSLDQVFVDY